MIDIIEVFQQILSHNRTIDVADSEFKKMIYEDDEIKIAYKQWCQEEGYTEKYGFIEFCQAYFDEEESRWDILNNEEYE